MGADGPTNVGDYTIVRELGRGGMGVVYVAHSPALGRDVALKLLLSDTDPAAIERFQIEAQATAALDHRNLVRIHKAGVHAGKPYYAMDLVDGRPLDDLLEANGPFDETEAARIAEAIARGLAHAHARGILHRDMKPANVLLQTNGDPLVTDFGLAKDLSASYEALTQTGQRLGTPAYMPPEQADGDVAAMGPQSDVYSVGATLYELLTGRAPFVGATAMNILLKVFGTIPDPPSAVRPELDPALDLICLKCLEKDPADRYGSAEALADDLGRFQRGEDILARPRTVAVRLRRFVERNTTPLVTAAAVAVLLWAGTYTIRTTQRNATIDALNADVISTIGRDDSAKAQAKPLPTRAQVAALSSRLSVLGNDDTALELSRLHLRVLDALLLAETDPSAARKARADLADAKLEGGWLDALDTRLSALDPTQRETGDEEARARRACNKLGLVDLRGWRAVLLTRSARRSLPFKKILDDLAAVKELRDLNSAELRARVLALRTRAAPKDAQALAETLARLSASPRGLTWPFVVEHLEQLLAGGREDEALAWILKTSGGPKPVTGRPRGRADFNWAKPVRRWLGSLPRGHQADAPSEPFAASTLQALEGGFAAHFGPRWRTEHYDPNAEAQTLNKRYRELLDNDAVRRRLIALARIAVIFGSPLDPIFCRPLMDPIHSLNEEDWKSRTPDGPIQAALELTKLGGEVCDPNDVAALRALLTGALVFRDKPEQRQLIPILRQYARIQPDLFERQLGRLDLADALVLAGRDAQEDRTRDRLFSEARDVLAAFDSEDDAVRTYTMKSTASLYRFRMHRIEGAQEKALAAIDKAILLFGAEPKYHNERGQLLAQMGPLRRAQAIASFTSDIQGSVIFGWGAEVAADAAWSVAVQDDALLHSMETLATYVLEHDPGFVRWRLRRAYVRLHGKKTAAVVLPDLDAALATTSHRKEGPRVIRQVERLRSRLGNPASNLGVIQSDLKSLLRRIAARVENDKTRPRRQR